MLSLVIIIITIYSYYLFLLCILIVNLKERGYLWKIKIEKQLSSRHITMLALGGAIGAGLFKGSGEAIGIAGPSVLIAF